MFGALAALAALSVCVGVRPAAAQEELRCGEAVQRTLSAGATHAYRLSAPLGASIFLQSSDVSGTIGPVRMRVRGAAGQQIADTCGGIAQFSGSGGEAQLEVSACSAGASGVYTATLNIVSDSLPNCGRALPCGATPEGVGFKLAGEVDAWLLSLTASVPATLKLNYTQMSGAPQLRLYGPNGEVVLARTCAGQTSIMPTATGVYTALISACGQPVRAPYRIEYYEPSCPMGPVITTFGITNATNDAQQPIGYDELDRPVFNHPFGQGLSLILEARAGGNGRKPGVFPVPYEEGDVTYAPDLQVILEHPLGDGNPLICDTFPPDLGGVPATVPFVFPATPLGLDIVHDMGCRFIDGAGELIARTSSSEACTRSNEGFGFNFVDRGSNLQFCAPIASAWAFPRGDTTVAARIKGSRGGAFGTVREIVVRIGDPTPPTLTPTPSATPTATATPTITATRTRTRTPTPRATRTATATTTITPTASATPTGPTPTATETPTGPTPTPPPVCSGDCDGSGQVTIEDIIAILKIVLGQSDVTACPPGDLGNDGQIGIPDLIAAVISALEGCRS